MADRYKTLLRNLYSSVRKHLSSNYQNRASRKVCQQIKNIHQYRYAKKIAIYYPMNGEIDLRILWQASAYKNRTCYFPVLQEDQTLAFLPASSKTPMKLNRFNIPEPDLPLKHAVKPEAIDMIFLPLLAFDHQGNRLGMGAGYYDRTLADLNHPHLYGVAYGFQQEHLLKAETWDIPLKAIVTPNEIIWSKK